MFALERAARFTVNVPRKRRTPRSRPSPSSMATTPWTRVIEKQRSVELQNPETSPSSSCFAESKKRRVSKGVGPSSSSSSRPLKEGLRLQQNPNLDPFFAINVSKQEEERSIRKKPKLVLPTETTPPEWLVDVMMREGNGYDPKLIIAKELFQSDLDKGLRRLSMPLKQVVNSDFLTEEESRIIHEQSVLKSRKEGVSVDLVDPLLKKHVVDLRKWKMKERWYYVFVDNWNDVVANNTFEVGNVYHVWSFRSGIGKLCFALVTPPSPTRNSGQDGGSTFVCCLVVESISHAPKDLPAESMGCGSVLPHMMELDDHPLFGDFNSYLNDLVVKDTGRNVDRLPDINSFDKIDDFDSFLNDLVVKDTGNAQKDHKEESDTKFPSSSNPAENWVQVLDGIGKMQYAKDAPDTGSFLPPKERRFALLLGSVLSIHPKDQVLLAIRRLHQNGLLTPEAVDKADESTIAKLIYSAGIKTRETIYMKIVAKICLLKYCGDIPHTLHDLQLVLMIDPKMAQVIMDIAWTDGSENVKHGDSSGQGGCSPLSFDDNSEFPLDDFFKDYLPTESELQGFLVNIVPDTPPSDSA